MLENFKHPTIQVENVKINVKIAGNGKPVLFLHGYPQTHKMWHKVSCSSNGVGLSRTGKKLHVS